MKMNYENIDQLVRELNEKINALTQQKEKCKTELEIIKNEQKEIMIQIDDMQKIIDSYSQVPEHTHAVFSPLEESETDGTLEIKEEEMNICLSKYEVICEKIDSKTSQYEKIVENIDQTIELMIKVQNIKTSVKKQIDRENNESYIQEMKEIYQKKRLLDKNRVKYVDVKDNISDSFVKPVEEIMEQLKLAMNFVQTDPNRCKQIYDKAYGELEQKLTELNDYMNKLTKEKKMESLKKEITIYIESLKDIYKSIQMKLELNQVENMDYFDDNLNRYVMHIFTSLVNVCILQTNPTALTIRCSYQDGYFNIILVEIGKYINFYEEMKNKPDSNIAKLYENVFLLNGKMNFQKEKNGMFTVSIKLPIKNYLN